MRNNVNEHNMTSKRHKIITDIKRQQKWAKQKHRITTERKHNVKMHNNYKETKNDDKKRDRENHKITQITTATQNNYNEMRNDNTKTESYRKVHNKYEITAKNPRTMKRR